MIRNGCTDKQKEEYDKKVAAAEDARIAKIKKIAKQGAGLLVAGAVGYGVGYSDGKTSAENEVIGEKVETIINASQEDKVEFKNISSQNFEHDGFTYRYAELKNEDGDMEQYFLKLTEQDGKENLVNFVKSPFDRITGYYNDGSDLLDQNKFGINNNGNSGYCEWDTIERALKSNGMMKETKTMPAKGFMEVQKKLNSGR